MRNTSNDIRTDCTFRRVAAYVNSCDCDLSREKIDLAFPELTPRQIAKALENACHRRLIHSVSRNIYRGGAKPEPTASIRIVDVRASTHAPDTSEVVSSALRRRTAIESAWQSMVSAQKTQSYHAFA